MKIYMAFDEELGSQEGACLTFSNFQKAINHMSSSGQKRARYVPRGEAVR